jgi:hypothetical protein
MQRLLKLGLDVNGGMHSNASDGLALYFALYVAFNGDIFVRLLSVYQFLFASCLAHFIVFSGGTSNFGDILSENHYGQRPLHNAAWNGHTEAVIFLLRVRLQHCALSSFLGTNFYLTLRRALK